MKKLRASLIILSFASLYGCGYGSLSPWGDSSDRPVMTEREVCASAIRNGEWAEQWGPGYIYVQAAKVRRLSLAKCQELAAEFQAIQEAWAAKAAYFQAKREAWAAKAAEATKPTSLQLPSDAEVCKKAINQTTKFHYADVSSEWVEEANEWVEEAKDRNLTLGDCRIITFEAATDKEVCRSAVAMNGEWETNPHLIGWKTEAIQRGFTTQSCTPIVLSKHTNKSICMFSIRNDQWTIEDLFYVNEAKRRGLSPAKCKLL